MTPAGLKILKQTPLHHCTTEQLLSQWITELSQLRFVYNPLWCRLNDSFEWAWGPGWVVPWVVGCLGWVIFSPTAPTRKLTCVLSQDFNWCVAKVLIVMVMFARFRFGNFSREWNGRVDTKRRIQRKNSRIPRDNKKNLCIRLNTVYFLFVFERPRGWR